jgi:hypothetical protein
MGLGVFVSCGLRSEVGATVPKWRLSREAGSVWFAGRPSFPTEGALSKAVDKRVFLGSTAIVSVKLCSHNRSSMPGVVCALGILYGYSEEYSGVRKSQVKLEEDVVDSSTGSSEMTADRL